MSSSESARTNDTDLGNRAATQRRFDFELVVASYGNRTDRGTIHPRNCSKETKLTTWLTADVDAFVDLEAAR